MGTGLRPDRRGSTLLFFFRLRGLLVLEIGSGWDGSGGG